MDTARAELAAHLHNIATSGRAIRSAIGRLNPEDLRNLLEACPFASIYDVLLDVESWASSVVDEITAGAA